MHSLMRRAWVEIDLGALVRNGAVLQKHAGVPILPMVKADAYGLGAVRATRALERLNPWGYGVATVAEGEILRKAGITRRILVFTPLLVDDFEAAERANLTPTLSEARSITLWGQRGKPWHLAIDTGMNRAGVQWSEVDALRSVLRVHAPEGAFTHFHSAASSTASREEQEGRFRAALSQLPVQPAFVHAENSAGIEHRDRSPWSFARPGVFLYGVGSGHEAEIAPEPVASLRARIVDLRTVAPGETVSYDATFRAASPCRIATAAIGYADGYRRSLGNRGVALLNGQRVAVAGVVTMDMTMLDVTDVECRIGDLATFLGREPNRANDECIEVNDVARAAELSPYEILTGLQSRLPRRYLPRDS